MDIPALLLACSLHADDALPLSIAYVHSGGNPHAVVNVRIDVVEQDEGFGLDVAPSLPSAARAAVDRILALGGEPALGLLPARPEWAVEFDKTIDDLFEPCANIAVGSAKLSEFDYACRSRGPQLSSRRRACALDLYGTSVGLHALRRSVLADITLPQPFPTDDFDASSAPLVVDTSTSSELFFRPASPGTSLLTPDFPSLLQARP